MDELASVVEETVGTDVSTSAIGVVVDEDIGIDEGTLVVIPVDKLI